MDKSSMQELVNLLTVAMSAVVKQEVDTAVKKATAHLATKDDLKKTEQRLNKRMDTMQAAVVETITNVNDAHDEHFNEHHDRLLKLEQLSGLRA